MMKVFISILHFNNTEDTDSCISSLNATNMEDLDLTVQILDNGSHSPLVLDESSYKNLQLRLIRSESNKGFSGGHNYLANLALKEKAEYILILNNDTIVSSDFLQKLIQEIRKDEKIALTVPKIYFHKGQEYHKERYTASQRGKVLWYGGGFIDWKNVIGKHIGVDMVDIGQYDEAKATEFATGCCMLIRAIALKDVGLFDERYFLYYEDADLCMRFRRKGYALMYTPLSVIWHGNAKSSGGSGSGLQDYYTTRNRLLFGFYYASLRTKLALIKESFFLLRHGRKWQKVGIKDFFTLKFGKGGYKFAAA